MAAEQIQADAAQLATFGYRQQLTRALGLRSNFSVGFTYLSPVVGVYTLFAFGLGLAGPAFIWTIPIVVAGQMLVVFTFAVVGIYISVQLVVLAVLIARQRGWQATGAFSLGGQAWLVNLVALAYGVAALVILSIKAPHTTAVASSSAGSSRSRPQSWPSWGFPYHRGTGGHARVAASAKATQV